jgi:glycosyltransferase involved in cell wall biosynthesis
MEVLHISTKDINGGAPRASYRLHQGLRLIGVDSKILVESKESNDKDVIAYKISTDLKDRFWCFYRKVLISLDFLKYTNTRPPGLEMFSDSRSQYRDSFQNTVVNNNVINLHWAAGFLDYESFFSHLPSYKPVVWTLHDMNPFTGGCHYSGSCEKFIDKCGSCPQLGSKKENDLSRSIWINKNKVLNRVKGERLHIVTPSKWLAEQAKKSSLFGNLPLSIIPYGIDTDLFRPRDTLRFRESLNIPADATIVGFVADATGNKRKGFQYLKEAIEKIKNKNIYLVSVGKSPAAMSKNINHIHLGNIQDDRQLSITYSLFDVYVCASVEDNLPNTVIESLACGTPVVGFPIGGIPDMVDSGITGMLTMDISSESLANCINEIISDRSILESMAIQCREKALNDYALHVQAEKYSKVYTTLCK